MKTNVGRLDRDIRLFVGIALLALIPLFEGDWRWIGLIGLIPFITALVRWCPLYHLFGLSTRPLDKKGEA